ncbi:aldose epimerase family protein [uncultured Merdimonas sp.]|uniref:aldose epimerase family protein n=1 Tax=uncultured Merdimonas sp. TaxID=2023269 RepID=UPI00320A8B77
MAETFGITRKGEKASLYLLENRQGMQAYVTDFGATLVRLLVPDRQGNLRDVVLGYDTAEGYEKGSGYFGATVGRVANRIGGGSFSLNGRIYELTPNDNGKHTLHGGRDFFGQRLWQVESADSQKIVFVISSPDGDQGFPGSVEMKVTYTLNDEGELKIHYHGVPDQDTPLNFTNHSYFNLNGHSAGDVLEQTVVLEADGYTRADGELIPTGEILPVEGTPMDFRQEKAIGRDIGESYEALVLAGGYDHNYVLNGAGMRRAAKMCSAESGICMEVYTDLPGIQFYTGNFVDHEEGKDKAVYEKHQGACFETQYYPDALHHENFPSPVVKAGETYETVTVYRFSANS